MEQLLQNVKENMLQDYKTAVWECLYYTYLSWLKGEKIEIIKQKYKLEIAYSYNKLISQIDKLNFFDLKDILIILDIEADDDYVNANRCEAIALILWDYINLSHKYLKES
jgi:hypothetical protein